MDWTPSEIPSQTSKRVPRPTRFWTISRLLPLVLPVVLLTSFLLLRQFSHKPVHSTASVASITKVPDNPLPGSEQAYSRLHVLMPSKEQMLLVDEIRASISLPGLDILPSEPAKNPTRSTFLRYFHPADSIEASTIADALTKIGLTPTIQVVPSDTALPGDFELSIGTNESQTLTSSRLYLIDFVENQQLQAPENQVSAVREAYTLAQMTPIVARLYLKGGLYSTVGVVHTKAEATNLLQTVQAKYPGRYPSAKVVLLADWCPKSAPLPPSHYGNYTFPVYQCSQ